MEVLLVVVPLLAFPLGYAFWYWSDTARIQRALRGAPRVSIAEAPEGEVVRLQGRVVAGETLEAPLTGRRCVYYFAIVEEESGGDWRERAREYDGVPFAIDDGSGRAIVDPANARVDVDLDRASRSGTFDEPTPRETAFLERHGLRGTGWIFNKNLRYREGVFEVGEPIAILCQPVREPDPDAAARVGGYRNAAPTRLRIGGSADHPILLSDSRDVTQARRR